MVYNNREILLSNNKFVNDHIIIEDINPPKIIFKKKVYYKCDICNEEFLTGNSIKFTNRKICRKHHFYYICDYCHKKFEINSLSEFIGSDKNERFCSHNCALQFRNRSDKQINAVIKMNKDRVKINLNKKQICSKCKKEFYSIFTMEICNGCITSNTNNNNFKRDQICIKCGQIFHSPFIMDLCQICSPNLNSFNFITKNNVRYYKDKPLDQLVEDLLYGKEDINNYPGFEIRLGRVTYNRKDVLTDETILLNGSNFITKDNVEYILNHSTWKYVEKDYFYKQFEEKFKSQDVNEELKKFIDLGFNIEPIIQIDSETWNRAQTDKYLSDKGYGWIVYIKLFQGKPFIVGKTGTSLVSKSPIDFDFRIYDENDLENPDYSGQGRRFIREFYPDIKYTDFDKILIKRFDSEQKALNCEHFIGIKRNLFFS